MDVVTLLAIVLLGIPMILAAFLLIGLLAAPFVAIIESWMTGGPHRIAHV
jgi:hypothetical protein